MDLLAGFKRTEHRKIKKKQVQSTIKIKKVRSIKNNKKGTEISLVRIYLVKPAFLVDVGKTSPESPEKLIIGGSFSMKNTQK